MKKIPQTLGKPNFRRRRPTSSKVCLASRRGKGTTGYEEASGENARALSSDAVCKVRNGLVKGVVYLLRRLQQD
jgi:hypothetical protein